MKNEELHSHEVLSSTEEKIRRHCTSGVPNSFWNREKYFLDIPYKEGFAGTPQKDSATQMSPFEAEYCKREIAKLLQRGLIEPSCSPWACVALYVNKHSEHKSGNPRMVINFRPLDVALMPIRYPLPTKELLFTEIINCNIFSKFDLKSGFWQIGITQKDRFKTYFVVPNGQY